MTCTHLTSGEKFPTSAKATVVTDDIIISTIKELKSKPCGEGLFCEKRRIKSKHNAVNTPAIREKMNPLTLGGSGRPSKIWLFAEMVS